jgi:hypothetical protein
MVKGPNPVTPPCSTSVRLQKRPSSNALKAPIGGAYATCTEEHVYHQRHPAVASAQEVRLTHLVGAAAPGRCRHLGGAEAPARALGTRVVFRSQQPRRAEETRGPQSGRAQEGRRATGRGFTRSAGREYKAFMVAIRGLRVLAAGVERSSLAQPL